MFKIGDMAVYPAHGVCKIDSIESREISGIMQTFYIIHILDSGARIMIPTENAASVGLRRIVDKSDVPKVYAVLRERRDVTVDNQRWNRRYRDYMEKIKTGSVIEIAKVLRDLYLIKIDKKLSFGEKKMMDFARSLLIKEISIAINTKEDRVGKELDGLMNI